MTRFAFFIAASALLGLSATHGGTARADDARATRYTMTAFTNSSESNMYMYESRDATAFTLLKGPAYTPPSGSIRDPSIFRHTDGYYYLTYTTRTWSALSTTIGFARSSDRVNWTFLYDYTVPIPGLQRAWAPEWRLESIGTATATTATPRGPRPPNCPGSRASYGISPY